MKTTLAAAILIVLVAAATAQANVADPRRCATNTPGGPTRHAYWCAHNNAVASVRAVMARRQAVAKWYAPTFCDQAGSLLRWRCQTFLGGDKWQVTVTWRATATGWHRYASVVKTQ